MLKYLTHKLKSQSISEDNMVQDKIDERDSGTESDGDLDHDKNINFVLDSDKDIEMSSKLLTAVSTNDKNAMLAHQKTAHLMYDQHSSEEELEVINGSSRLPSLPSAAALKSILSVRGTNDSVASESSSVEPEMFDGSPKRASSTISETRKRSLPHDDETRNLLDLIPTPVKFRSSPPLEAIRRIDFRVCRVNQMSLLETSRGIENIKISCDSSNVTDDYYQNPSNSDVCSSSSSSSRSESTSTNGQTNLNDLQGSAAATAGAAATPTTSSSFHLLGDNSCNLIQPQFNHQHHQQHHNHNHNQLHNQYQTQYYSHFSSNSSTSSLSLGDVRSVSPPAKVSRRPPRTHQRLHRPHRPCLDFDKMQQLQKLKSRSVGSWRQNEHTGDVSVFCW